MAFNPAYAQVNAEEIWGKAEGDVVVNGKSPEQAVDAAFERIKEIFAEIRRSPADGRGGAIVADEGADRLPRRRGRDGTATSGQRRRL